MAFLFPRTVYHTETPFTALLSLLDELESTPSRRGCPAYRDNIPRQPHFDVRETAEAYVLRGELPGLNKDHVTIELAEPQKLVIRARYGAAANSEETKDDAATSDAASESSRSHQATVEDDTEGDDFEVVDEKAEKAQKQPSQPRADKTEDNYSAEYSRTFKFAYPVDYDAVTANIRDGLLNVVVPKPKKTEPRRIYVN